MFIQGVLIFLKAGVLKYKKNEVKYVRINSLTLYVTLKLKDF